MKLTVISAKQSIALVLTLSAFFLSGCAGPKIASDLLSQTPVQESPIVDNGVKISVQINPRINNYEKIDQSVKESLRVALETSNIFGTELAKPYQINANIITASQARMSFGSFEGTLEIIYTVTDEVGNEVLEKSIYTEAGSDRWYFFGAKRHRRARAVNISENVLQFVEVLRAELGE